MNYYKIYCSGNCKMYDICLQRIGSLLLLHCISPLRKARWKPQNLYNSWRSLDVVLDLVINEMINSSAGCAKYIMKHCNSNINRWLIYLALSLDVLNNERKQNIITQHVWESQLCWVDTWIVLYFVSRLTVFDWTLFIPTLRLWTYSI